MAKIEVTPVTSGYNIQALNTTLQAIEDEFKNKVVYVDEISPMERDLDVNGFGLINVGTVNGVDVTALQDIGEYVDIASDAAASAATSEIAAAASAQSAAEDAAAVLDAKLIWQGPWSGATQYFVNDAVSIGGRSYIAILDNLNQTPPNASYWDLLADRGIDGTAGAGTGDASTNTASSVDNEIALFSGAAGKTLKRATGTGLVKIISGVMATAIEGTDYITGNVPVPFEKGGTNADTAQEAFDGLKQAATTSYTGVVELSTNAEAQTGTDPSKAVTPDNLGATVLGMGQTWQNLTASRTTSTNYTNSTGRSIMISVSGQSPYTVSAASASLTVGGVVVASRSTNESNGISYQGSAGALCAIVPPGAVYRVDGIVGGFTISSWAELR